MLSVRGHLPVSHLLGFLVSHQIHGGGDCGPLSVKFIEFHMRGLQHRLSNLTDSQVDNIRVRYAIDIYEAFVKKLEISHLS